MERETLDSYCEKGILTLVAAALVLGPLLVGSVLPSSQSVLLFLTLLAGILWGIRICIQQKFRLFWPPLSWVVVTFFIYAVIVYFQASVEYPARKELVRITVYTLLFLITLNNLNKPEHAAVLVFVILSTAMALSFYALYQSKFAANSEWIFGWQKQEHFMGRGSGSFFCPNHFAGYLEMAIPLGLAFTLTSRMGHIPRLFLGYCTLASLVGLFVSFSRGGWIAGACGILTIFVIVMRNQRYRKPVLVTLLAMVALSLVVLQKSETMQSRFQNLTKGGTIDDVTIRFAIWGAAREMWKDHIWTGMGPAQFDEQFPQYRPRAIQWRPLQVHNDYLNALVDYGVLGIGMILMGLAFFGIGIFKTLHQISRNTGDLGAMTSNRLAMTLGGLGAFAAIAVHSLVDFNMYIPANAMTMMVIIALTTAQYRYASSRTWVYPGAFSRGVLILSVLAVSFFAFPEGYRQYRERAFLKKAATMEDWQERMENLKMAHTIDPRNDETIIKIGKSYLHQSSKGESDYVELAEQALEWLQLAGQTNPINRHAPLYQGVALDWIGRHEEAESKFQAAIDLDPNNHYSWALFGEHYCWTQDYWKARRAILRSLEIWPWENQKALAYRTIIEDELRALGQL